MYSLDAHTHLQDSCFDADRDAVLRHSEAVGVSRWICNGTQPDDWPEVRRLAEKHPGIVPCFGIHPWFADREVDSLHAFLRNVDFPFGIGEVGLDFAAAPKNDPRQEFVLRSQLKTARQRSLPVMLHAVRCVDRLLTILREEGPFPVLLIHSFSGPKESIPDFVKLGAFFSFSPAIFRPNARRLHEAVHAVPLDRVLFESDASATRNSFRTEPAIVPDVLNHYAVLRGLPNDELADIAAENAERLLANFFVT